MRYLKCMAEFFSGKLLKMRWIILFGILTVCFLGFRYGDVIITTDNSLLLIESITKGEFFDFYDYSVKNALICLADYEIPIYIIFALWNLPLFFAEKVWGADVLYSTIAILWTKLLVLLFLIGVAYFVYKICVHLGNTKRVAGAAVFLFFSSVIVTLPALVVEQYDCISLFFMTAGLFFYLKNDIKKFILCFAIAIPLKMFALFIFLPLVLLKEKRVWKIVSYGILGCLLLGACKLLFRSDPAYQFALKSFSNSFINRFLTTGFDFRFVVINGFILGEVFLCIWAYVKKVNAEEQKYYAVYICSAAFGLFMCFYSFHAYWIIIMAPFFIIMLMQNSKYFKVNLLLDLVGNISITLYLMLTQPHIFKSNILDNLLLVKIFGTVDESVRKFDSPGVLLTRAGIDFFVPILFTVFIAVTLSLLVLNYPGKARETVSDKILGREEGIMWGRIAVLAVFVALIIYCYFKTVNPVTAEFTGEPIKTDCNVLAEDVITQEFYSDRDTELEELMLRFSNNANNQFLRSSLLISVIDETGTAIFEKRIGTSIIPRDEDFYISLNGTEVEADKVYALQIKPLDGGENICWLVGTKGLVQPEYPAKVGNEIKEFNIYMSIR